MSVTAFPWRRLPRVSRQAAEDLIALRQIQASRPFARTQAALSALAETTITVTPTSVGRFDAMTPPSSRGVIRLSLTNGAWVAVEVDIALAARVAAAVTKRPASSVLREGERAPVALGVFAAIVSSALRKAGYPATMSVLSSFSQAAVGGDDVSVADLAIVAFDETTRARVFFPEARLREGARWDEVDVMGLGDAPISFPIVGCRLVATAEEVAALSTGDTWVLGKGLVLAGEVWLVHAATSPAGFVVHEDGR